MITLFRIDMTIGPIEESFALLNKYGLHYSSHDSERVDSLTYSWKKVNSQVFLPDIQFFSTARKSVLKLVTLQSLVAKCGEIRKIWAWEVCKISVYAGKRLNW